ncbi:hypothetical protein N9M78_00935 [Alphaproteobacteria bacterium]|nr:hypothetical protein [Alphaproteobacteria bacterium]
MLSILAFMSVLSFIWFQIPQGLLAGHDGRFFLSEASSAFAEGVGWQTTRVNFINGAYGLSLTFNPMLTFSFFGLLFDETLTRFATSLVAFVAFTVSTGFLARRLGVSYSLLPLALFVPNILLIYPFQYETTGSVQFLIMPDKYLSVSQFNLMLFIFLSDKKKIIPIIKDHAAICLILLWAIISAPLWAAVHGLFYAPIFLAALFCKIEDSKSTCLKHRRFDILGYYVLAGLTVVLVLFMLGPLEYIYSLVSANSRSMLGEEYNRHGWHESHLGYVTLATYGKFALITILTVFFSLFAGFYTKNTFLRRVNIGLFLNFMLYLGLIAYYVLFAKTWAFPYPIYYEESIWHIYIIFIFALLSNHLRSAFDSKLTRVTLRKFFILSVLVLQWIPVIYALDYAIKKVPHRAGIYNDAHIDLEAAAISDALQKVKESKGRNSSSVLFHYSELGLRNGMYVYFRLMTDNHRTMNEYSQNISPVSHLIVSRLAASKNIPHNMNHSSIQKINTALFQMFGVEFVITRKKLESPELNLETSVNFSNATVYIYSIRSHEPILRPSNIKKVSTLQSAIQEMKKPSFDPKSTALIYDDKDDFRNVTPALKASFSIKKDTLYSEIISSGRSVTVFPVFYSNCWKNLTELPIRILRANGGFLAVETKEQKSDIKLRFEYGVFNPKCRMQDKENWHQDLESFPEDLRWKAEPAPNRPTTWQARVKKIIRASNWY